MAYKYAYGYEEEEVRKVPKLQTNRSMWKLMILNILTLGIYSIIFFIPFSFDLDKISPKKDLTKTMNYVVAFVLSMFTFSIVLTIWHYQIADRIDETLTERDVPYEFDTGTFWIWYFLGSLLFFVGPFVYMYKLCKAMNLLCENYNEEAEKKAATRKTR